MSQKDMKYSALLDYYGELLSENQRTVMDMYYNEDFSLSEIADEICITRQGVHDALHRAEDALDEFEFQLGLMRTHEKKAAIAKKLRATMEDIENRAKPLKKSDYTLDDRFRVLEMLIDDLDRL